MLDAQERGNWNAVGLNAVHTVISAADAIVSFHIGERSSSEDHRDAADLLAGLDVADAPEKSKQATQVLDVKDLVEYQARDFEPKEAAAAASRATRFLEWVKAGVDRP